VSVHAPIDCSTKNGVAYCRTCLESGPGATFICEKAKDAVKNFKRKDSRVLVLYNLPLGFSGDKDYEVKQTIIMVRMLTGVRCAGRPRQDCVSAKLMFAQSMALFGITVHFLIILAICNSNSINCPLRCVQKNQIKGKNRNHSRTNV